MPIEDLLNSIRAEFMTELDKREELLDNIANLQNKINQLKRDLAAYRSIYLMKNEMCDRCEFADECIDANRVEGRKCCTSFHAQIDD